MIPLILVLAFPIVSGLVFTAAYFLHWMLYGAEASSRMNRRGHFIHALSLLIPLTAVWVAVGWSGISDWWLAPPLDSMLLPMLLLIVASAGLGVALFYNELWISKLAMRAAHRGGPVYLGATAFGAGSRFAWAVAVFIVVIEELLWRGYLLTAIPTEWGWNSVGTLALSAAVFGANHYYFGLRNVLLKAVDGLVWGALFLFSGSLLLPFASHLAFELWVMRQLPGRGKSV